MGLGEGVEEGSDTCLSIPFNIVSTLKIMLMFYSLKKKQHKDREKLKWITNRNK